MSNDHQKSSNSQGGQQHTDRQKSRGSQQDQQGQSDIPQQSKQVSQD